MPDIATQLEIRRRITECEHDMRRATERATDACKTISRAIVLFNTPLDIDLDIVNAAVADIREARFAYTAAMKKRSDLRDLLGEG
jgi:ABC-type transport system involved in Fe-S cluster assembly fused permease/ATPase subunit